MNKLFKSTICILLISFALLPMYVKAETEEEMLNRIINSISENYELRVPHDVPYEKALRIDLSASIEECIMINTNCEDDLCTIELETFDGAKKTKQVKVSYKQDNEEDKKYILDVAKKLKSNEYKIDSKKYWKNTIKNDNKDYKSILLNEIKKVINDNTIEIKLTSPKGGFGDGPSPVTYLTYKDLYLLKNGIIYFPTNNSNNIVSLSVDNVIYVPYGTKKENYISEAKKVYSEISGVDINKITMALTDDFKEELGNKELYKITYPYKVDNVEHESENYYFIEVADKEQTTTNNSTNNGNISNDTGNNNTSNKDNNTSNKDNVDNNSANATNKDNIENPQTGRFISHCYIIIPIIALVLFLIVNKKSKKLYKF